MTIDLISAALGGGWTILALWIGYQLGRRTQTRPPEKEEPKAKPPGPAEEDRDQFMDAMHGNDEDLKEDLK
ncbi:MAG: hypothetical protein WC455_25610 [Dehalococcoidia bacterium]|jgi:hypothetical protein